MRRDSNDLIPDPNLPISQIAKKFNLYSTYDTLEGHQRLSRPMLFQLFEFSAALAKDQGGCRLLQKYIQQSKESDDKEMFDHIYRHSIPHAWGLMNDSFGNYLIQRLAEDCSSVQLTEIIYSMQHEPVKLCMDTHGTRSV